MIMSMKKLLPFTNRVMVSVILTALSLALVSCQYSLIDDDAVDHSCCGRCRSSDLRQRIARGRGVATEGAVDNIDTALAVKNRASAAGDGARRAVAGKCAVDHALKTNCTRFAISISI